MDQHDNLGSILETALSARAEVAVRPDRCRAVLGDLLAASGSQHRREVGLLVAAVEEGVPEALRHATSTTAVDVIAERFAAERALEPAAARWSVQTWSEALSQVTGTSVPTLSEPNPTVPGDLTPAAAPTGSAVPGDLTPAAPAGAAIPGDLTPAAVSTLPTALPTSADDAAPGSHDSAAMPAAEPTPRTTPRAAISAAVAALTAIAIVVASFAVLSGNGGHHGSASATALHTQDLAFKSEPVSNSVMLTRKWHLGGTNGDRLTGTVTFMNSGAHTQHVAYDEVFPDALASSPSAVTLSFRPQRFPAKWISSDPVLRVNAKLVPGATVTLGYRVKVKALGVHASRLTAWEAARAAAAHNWKALHSLRITHPTPGAHVTTSSYTVHGTVEAGTHVALLGVRRSSHLGTHGRVTIPTKHSRWTHKVTLTPGPNYLFFATTNSAGTVPTVIHVTYTAPHRTAPPLNLPPTGGNTGPGPSGGNTNNGGVHPVSAPTITSVSGSTAVMVVCASHPYPYTYTAHTTGTVNSVTWQFNGVTWRTGSTVSIPFTADKAGQTLHVKVTASGPGGSVSKAFDIRVAACPAAPTITSVTGNTSPTVVCASNPYPYTYTAHTTGDVDTVTWQFNGVTWRTGSTVSIPFTADKAGQTLHVKVTASGPHGSTAVAFDIHVYACA